MTRGVLIFAQNNSDIDYVQIAIFSAKQVKTHLNVPVTLVTENREYFLATYPADTLLIILLMLKATFFNKNNLMTDL